MGQKLTGHFLRSVSNPTVLTEYAKLAGPAIQTGGGRLLTRGTAVLAFEAGVKERSVVIECDSPAYQSALKLLKGAVERGVRILESVC